MDSNPQRPRRTVTADFPEMDFLSTELRVAVNILLPSESPYRAVPARETAQYFQDLIHQGEDVAAVLGCSTRASTTTASTVPLQSGLTATALLDRMREVERRMFPDGTSRGNNPYSAWDYHSNSFLRSYTNPFASQSMMTPYGYPIRNPYHEVALPGGGRGDRKPNPFDLIFKEEAHPPKDPVQLELF